jgi:hypothetical protein
MRNYFSLHYLGFWNDLWNGFPNDYYGKSDGTENPITAENQPITPENPRKHYAAVILDPRKSES